MTLLISLSSYWGPQNLNLALLTFLVFTFLQDHTKNVRRMITSDDVDSLLCPEADSAITMIVTEALP